MSATKTARPRDAGTAPHFKLLTTSEAADVLGIGNRTLQEKVEAREIGFVKFGRALRFHPDDLTDFIERHRAKAQGWKGGN